MGLYRVLEDKIGQNIMVVLSNHNNSITAVGNIASVYSTDETIEVELEDGSEITIGDYDNAEDDGDGHYYIPNEMEIFIGGSYDLFG